MQNEHTCKDLKHLCRKALSDILGLEDLFTMTFPINTVKNIGGKDKQTNHISLLKVL